MADLKVTWLADEFGFFASLVGRGLFCGLYFKNDISKI